MARFAMANLLHLLPCLEDYARRLLHVPHAPARRPIPLTLPFYAETSHWCYGHGPYAPASGQSLCSSLCFVCRDIPLVLWARAICPCFRPAPLCLILFSWRSYLGPCRDSQQHPHVALYAPCACAFFAASAGGAICSMRLCLLSSIRMWRSMPHAPAPGPDLFSLS